MRRQRERLDRRIHALESDGRAELGAAGHADRVGYTAAVARGYATESSSAGDSDHAAANSGAASTCGNGAAASRNSGHGGNDCTA